MEIIQLPKRDVQAKTYHPRHQQHVTAAEMARILGRSPATIGRYLTQEHNPMPGNKVPGGGWDIPKHDALVWSGRLQK